MASFWRREPPAVVLALAAVVATTASLRLGLRLTNPTTAALLFLLVILITAATSRLWVAIVTSVAADLCLNYFFMPPFGTLTIADPQNWVALFVFFAVGLIGSQLSAAVRDREQEASARRDELGRLFDLSRDVLLTTDSTEAIRQLARFVARRFDLDFAAVCLPRAQQWDIYEAGARSITLDPRELVQAFAGAESALEFDARARTYAGHRTIPIDGEEVRLIPLRFGTKAIGLLAAAGRPVEPDTLDALAGVVAIAVERAQFLEERKAAEVARRGEELKSALLASLSHDLKTPLTAIRVAASNLKAAWIREHDREEQSDLILAEVERLNRLFQNILEMARIDAGSIPTDVRWVHPAEIFEAARDQIEHTLKHHRIVVEDGSDRLVRLDPRLTASALAHVLENAAQYTQPKSPIDVNISVSTDGLTISVRDHGPGISPRDLPHLFDRFYRGTQAGQRVSGTGMGLSIARGMLAAEGGRVWADNCADGGAQFTIVVPAESKVMTEQV
ncbi:MAG TPA: ATP-binding protein [Vicinamibacterales bacterium]|nr:ATP-binding protein [Vicinamibacterales bacterium]